MLTAPAKLSKHSHQVELVGLGEQFDIGTATLLAVLKLDLIPAANHPLPSQQGISRIPRFTLDELVWWALIPRFLLDELARWG